MCVYVCMYVLCVYVAIRQDKTTVNSVVENNKCCKFILCDWLGHQNIVSVAKVMINT